MIDVTIDFKKWKFGKQSESQMLSADGCRCWLGFLGQACGVPDEEMLERGTPNSEKWPITLYNHWPSSSYHVGYCTFLASKIANHNDFTEHPDGSCREYKPEERINNLIELSKEAGFNVTINYEG